MSSVRGAKPRRDKRQARCVCYVCVSLSLCVGWIDSAEETQTHRLLSACYFSLPPLLLFVYFSRFSTRRPHCNFSSIIWKILSFFPPPPPLGDYNGPTGRLVTSQHGRCFLLTLLMLYYAQILQIPPFTPRMCMCCA